MNRLGAGDGASVAAALRGSGLCLRTGPFSFRLRSGHRTVCEGLRLLYADHEARPDSMFTDFQVTIGPGRGMRRWLGRQARFVFDGQAVFEPLPAAQAYPMLEWAMNWCISSHAHRYLILHAAVLARGDRALVMPAPPGSGKSTLCAGLLWSGWRLLSDELALIDMVSGQVVPLCRPVSLKNASIDVIRRFAPQAVFNALTHDTAKGTVTHMKVPAEQLAQVAVPATVRWIVFPRYRAGSAAAFAPHRRAEAVLALSRNSFNIALHGEAGFDRLCDLVQAADCSDFSYGDLHEAARAFDALAQQA